ncbi:hypothetical protein HDU87_007562 [Geranomyces variabilis]|uniref:Uncharacterized protein n=1 Tax=Geranomyces variabilis TaxID=109894 RepID=A0AAD5XTR2_9FUNG|nr:hypothetical protein HDU87_007562 [Geranomyces variabilis]
MANATDTWLDLPLPAYDDFLSVTAGTTVSPHGIRPRSVLHWPQFLTEAAAYRFPHMKASNIVSITGFDYNCDHQLYLHWKAICGGKAFCGSVAADPAKIYYVGLEMPDPRGGCPDLSVTCGTQMNPMRNPTIFVMEVKKTPVLHHSPTGTAPLHIRYNTGVGTYDQGRTSGDTAVVLAIFQANGYLNAHSLRYGALTTYDFTWFLRREGDVLYISDPIHSQAAGPASCSVMRAIAHTLTLSLGNNGTDGRSPPAPSYQAPHGVSSGETSGMSTEHSSYHPGSGDCETSATDENNNGSGSGTLSDAPTMSTYEKSYHSAEVYVHNFLAGVARYAESVIAPAAAPAADTIRILNPSLHPITSRYTPQNPQDIVWGSSPGHGLHGTVIRCQWKDHDVPIKTVDRKSHANAATLSVVCTHDVATRNTCPFHLCGSGV